MNNQTVRSMWHVYARKGMAFVPDVARTDAGFFMDVEPVRAVNIAEIESLASAIEQAMAAGNPQSPTPTRATFPKPVILKPARTRSWNAFVERGACFTIFAGAGSIEIFETGRNEKGEWEDAPELNQTLPQTSPPAEIARRVAERVAKRNDLG